MVNIFIIENNIGTFRGYMDYINDAELAAALWEKSEAIIGETFFDD